MRIFFEFAYGDDDIFDVFSDGAVVQENAKIVIKKNEMMMKILRINARSKCVVGNFVIEFLKK